MFLTERKLENWLTIFDIRNPPCIGGFYFLNAQYFNHINVSLVCLFTTDDVDKIRKKQLQLFHSGEKTPVKLFDSGIQSGIHYLGCSKDEFHVYEYPLNGHFITFFVEDLPPQESVQEVIDFLEQI